MSNSASPPKRKGGSPKPPLIEDEFNPHNITIATSGQTKRVDIWMPLYVGDFAIDTAGLSAAEVGAYTLLAVSYWRGGGLPNDEAVLMRMARLSKRQFKAIWPRLSPQFFVADEDRIVNHKLDRELAFSLQKMRTYSERASKAATVRWQQEKDASSMPQAVLKPCPSPSPSPLPLPRVFLSNGDNPQHHNGRERNTWDSAVEELVERFSVPADDVHALRRKHSDNIKRLNNGAYPTPDNFMRFAESALTHSTQQRAKAAPAPLNGATKLRKRWWDQWLQETSCDAASSWEGASNTDRSAFMLTKYGEYFVAMAGGPTSSAIDIDEFGNIHPQT